MLEHSDTNTETLQVHSMLFFKAPLTCLRQKCCQVLLVYHIYILKVVHMKYFFGTYIYINSIICFIHI